MTSLETSPQALLVGLKKLLDDQYDVASICKELLQNAEDARASELHFAWVGPHRGQSHPLLQTHGLIVVNNGDFSWNNSTKIALQGLGGKGADQNAIGKFGLGMKSVFNLTETLFYLASPNQDASRRQAELARNAGRITPKEAENWHFQECLNPWHKTSQHDDWRLDDEAVERALHEQILAVMRDFEPCKPDKKQPDKKWFALYLPLRSDEMVRGGGALTGLTPLPRQILDEQMPTQIAALWPMLRHLQRVKVWTRSKDDAKFVIDFGLTCKSARHSIEAGKRLPAKIGVYDLTGVLVRAQSVNAGRRAANDELHFCGVETLLARENILTAELDARWPQTYVWKESTEGGINRGDFELEREKGEPHAAAVWMQTPPETGATLHVGAGVFLPLPDAKTVEEGQSETFALGEDAGNTGGVRLLLHGYFFVDGGRRHLMIDPQSRWGQPDEKPESAWNRGLLEQGALPLVLPALAAFAARCGLGSARLRDITRALRDCGWNGRHPGAIARGGTWIYRLDGPSAPLKSRAKASQAIESGNYRLLPQATEFWSLPALAKGDVVSGRALFRWFPGLAALAKTRVLTWADAPRIAATAAMQWDAESLLAALKGVNASEIFAGTPAMRYFNELLGECRLVMNDPEVSARLRAIARDGLVNWRASSAKNAELCQEWARFWRLMPTSGWLPFLPRRSTESDAGRETLWRAMLDLEPEKLPVPPEMVPGFAFDEAALAQGDGQWNGADARRLAQWLETQLSADAPVSKRVENFTLDLINATQGDFLDKERALGQFAIFPVRAYDASTQADPREFWASWAQLNAWRGDEQTLLWGVALEGRAAQGGALLRKWMQVSQGEPIYSVVESGAREISHALWGENLPDNFGPRACLSLLSQTPPLQAPALRQILWDDIRHKPDEMESKPYQIAIRYFLHADVTRRDDLETPLFYAPARAPLWRKVAAPALEARGQSWRLLAPELSVALDDLAENVNLQRLDATGSARLLDELGEAVRELTFDLDQAQARQVLCGCPCQSQTWRALPLHQRKSGGWTALDEATHWEDEIPVPPFLARQIQLLERPEGDLLDSYKKHGVRPFGPQSVLDLALCAPQPHRYAGAILDALRQTEAWDEQTNQQLQATPWLHDGVETHPPFAPRDLMLLPAAVEAPLAELMSARHCQLWREQNWRFATAANLAPLFQSHKAWGRSLPFLPDVETSVATLCQLLEVAGDSLALAPLKSLDGDEGIARFLEAWRSSGKKWPMGVELLNAVWQDASTRPYARRVAQTLAREVAPPHLIASLGALEAAAARPASDDASDDAGEAAIGVHRELFALLCASNVALADLKILRLPARNGQWKGAGELCLDAHGVENAALLDEPWAASFRNAAVGRHLNALPDVAAQTVDARRLRELTTAQVMDEWATKVGSSTEVLAAFAAIISRGGDMAESAEKWWHKGAQSLVWNQLCGSEQEGKFWLEEHLYNYPLEIAWVGGQTQTTWARNLSGQTREFALAPQMQSLLIGQVQVPATTGAGFRVGMRRVDERTSKDELLDLLEVTMRELLRQYAAHSPLRPSLANFFEENFERHFARWKVGRQADLEIARAFMLENALFYFRTLSGRLDGDLKHLIARYDNWRYTQHEHQGIEGNRSAGESKQAIVAELERLIVPGNELARQSLKLVRSKMEQLGYGVDSIPFELLQNADDAIAELRAALGEGWNAQWKRQTQTVALNIGEQTRNGHTSYVYAWRHCGRGINQFRVGTLSGEVGRERGYNRDLEKMLVLQASDKDDNATAAQITTTGKFGLGFKSVFLATDLPQIVSGDLAFQIVGGFFPRDLEAGQREAFRRDAPDEMQGATRIRFRSERAPKQLAERFVRYAPLCLLFARCVARLEISIAGQIHAIEPQRTQIWSNVETATLGQAMSFGAGKLAALPARALIVRAESGTLVLGLDFDGARALPADVPAFWSLAPTRNEVFVGWALNADWGVDVGRSQVPTNESNENIARELGRQIGQTLRSWWNASDDFAAVCQNLGIAATNRQQFWRNLGRVLNDSATSSSRLLRIFGHELRQELPAQARPWFEPQSNAIVAVEAEFAEADKEIGSQPLQPRAREQDETAYLQNIAVWWQRNRSDYFAANKHPFFERPDLVYPQLQSPDAAKRRAAWLRLLLRSTVEGIGQRNWDQHRAFLAFCESQGWIKEFSRPGASTTNLGLKLESYLADDERIRQKWLLWMRRALPMFGLCRWLDEYIAIFRALGGRAKCNDLSFLQPYRDAGWGALSANPQGPDLQNVLGIGAHFLMRELARGENNVGIFCDDRAHGLCFYPGERLRGVLSAIEPAIAAQDGVKASQTAWKTLRKFRADDPTLAGDFDLPLLLWAQKQ